MSVEVTARDSVSAQSLKVPILEGVAPASSFSRNRLVSLPGYKHSIVGGGVLEIGSGGDGVGISILRGKVFLVKSATG